ncbi:ParB/RepB/Spo0J family partition protein [Brachybacterium phenoliresistens]|uniref:ParB/RepB/Spo0J family partition protein n=1 Tax=Brachybacterium phenoliresistens TaxID=396014 RepID=UPI0031DBB59B
MTQRRGLGRGLGALIPGAGVSAPRASDQDPELRTRRPAEPEAAEAAESAATGPRPVDMFFSGDPLPESGESRARRRPGGPDLAGAMARAAAERRSAARGTSRRRSAEEDSADAAENGAGSSAEAAPEKGAGTTAARSGRSSGAKSAGTKKAPASAASSSAPKTSGAKSTGTKSTGSKSTGTKSAGAKSSAGTKASAGATSSSGAKASAGSTSSTRSKSAAGTAAKSAGTSGRSTAAKKTSAKIAASSPAVSDEAVENAGGATAAVARDVRIAEAASTAAAAEPRVEPSTAATTPADSRGAEDAAAEDRVEDSPIVDVEKVELVPARPAPEPATEDTAASAEDSADSDAAEGDPSGEQMTSEETSREETASEKASADASSAAAEPSSSDAQDASSATGHAGLSEGLVKVPGAEFAEIPIHEIRENPRNPRTMFDDDALDELAFSLREVGVLQPVVVRGIPVTEDGESFELVMGERRWRAAQRAGLTSIPAIIRETSDDDLLRDALLENLHRTQLNPLEEAAAYQQLLEDFGCTQDELSSRIGRSRPQISNTLRLMRLPALVQRRLASGALSAGHARALLTLEDPRLMEELAGRIVAEGLSVRAVERLVARGAEPGTRSAPTRRTTYNPRVVDITSRLSNQLEAPVRIDVGKRKGRITLEFTNLDDLERLVERLGIEQDAEEHTGTDD